MYLKKQNKDPKDAKSANHKEKMSKTQGIIKESITFRKINKNKI